MENLIVNLSKEERVECLKEIIKRLKKIIFVYEKAQEQDSNYNYKIFVKNLIFYISSANYLFNGKMVNIIVNLNSIMINNFEKKQLKSIVFEMLNHAYYLLDKERASYDL